MTQSNQTRASELVTLHTLLTVWLLSMQLGVDSKANSAYDTTALTAKQKGGLQHG